MAEEFKAPRSYYKISGGKFCRKVKEKTNRSITLTQVVKGETYVSEVEQCDTLSGSVQGVEFKSGNYGNYFEITINDGDWSGVLSLGEGSNAWRLFAKQLPRLRKGVVYSFDANQGKFVNKNTGEEVKTDDIFIRLKGESVGFEHTAKDPRGMPDGKYVMLNGKETLDRTDQILFMRAIADRYNAQPDPTAPAEASRPQIQERPINKRVLQDLPDGYGDDQFANVTPPTGVAANPMWTPPVAPPPIIKDMDDLPF